MTFPTTQWHENIPYFLVFSLPPSTDEGSVFSDELVFEVGLCSTKCQDSFDEQYAKIETWTFINQAVI